MTAHDGLKLPVDSLATRAGFLLAMLILCGATILSGLWFRNSTAVILSTQKELSQHQTSRSHAALSELVNLSSVVHLKLKYGSRVDEARTDIANAVEELRDRAQYMETYLNSLKVIDDVHPELAAGGSAQAQAANAIMAVTELVDWSAVALVSKEPATVFQSPEFLFLLDRAHRRVFGYLDATARMEERLLAWQTRKVAILTNATYAFLAVITVGGGITLKLFRGEIFGRKERDKVARRADHLAFHDPVTGLANRVKFRDHVVDHLKPGVQGGMILIDLDGFKEINDRHGHLFGDEVLKITGRRLRIQAEDNHGLAARLGGDEFAIFLSSDDGALLKRFCASLVADCARSINYSDERIVPGISVGLATTSQISTTKNPQYDDLLRITDFALYASKSNGRGRYTLYDADLERVFKERRQLIKEIPGAILQGEMEVYLQPKVNLKTDETVGFEGLVRWRRNGTILPPNEFVQVAEETGRIVDIDRYVLDRAIEIVSNWNRTHNTEFSVSVNLSGLHFDKAEELSFVQDSLSCHQFPARLLTLEVTETVQLENWEIVGRAVSGLRELGCRISIDDFGAGYSSLAYLRAINADELKIDKSLVAEIETSGQSQFILDAVLDLARSLDLDVVVEGIERQEQRDRLRDLGCVLGQGYLFDRPRPAADALVNATFVSRPRVDVIDA